jgi:hypothetical protein
MAKVSPPNIVYGYRQNIITHYIRNSTFFRMVFYGLFRGEGYSSAEADKRGKEW